MNNQNKYTFYATLAKISICLFFCFTVHLTAQTTFSGLGSDDSGGSGFKTVDNINIIVVSNNLNHAGTEIFGSGGAGTEILTIKADGTNAAFFDVDDIMISNFTGSSTFPGTTLEFKDSDGTTIKTMSGTTSLTSTPVSISSFFTNNNTLPVTGVAEMIFTVMSPIATSNFTIESVTLENAGLPVELISFTAKLQDENSVLLNWETATEVNNFGFQVQRKKIKDKSESEWEDIGFVQGYGTTNSSKNYEFTDFELPNSESVDYRLKQIDNDGTFAYSKLVTADLTTITSVDDAIEYEFALEQNYPNPFNPVTTIQFTIPTIVDTKFASTIPTNVTLVVFNSLGQEVATLINEQKYPGNYEVHFDATNLSSGVYFYKLSSGKFTSIKKLMLLK